MHLQIVTVFFLILGRPVNKLQGLNLSFFNTRTCVTRSSLVKNNNVSTKFNPLLVLSNITTQKSSILDNPLTVNTSINEFPLLTDLIYKDNINWRSSIEEPGKIIEKQAARLIVIRRRKMKRHKLKKLRKKMKFEWAKVRLKREMRKEKAFQAELMAKIRETEKFDAVAYATQKINKANEVLIPKLWKGKRLPEFLIKELLVEKENKKAKVLAKIERKKKISSKVSDYNV